MDDSTELREVASSFVPELLNRDGHDIDHPIDASFAAPKRYRGEWIVNTALGRAHLLVNRNGKVRAACGRTPASWFSAPAMWDGCSLCVGHAITLQVRVARDTPAPGSVDAWLDEWLGYMALSRPRSASFYRSKLAHVRPLIGGREMASVTARDIRLLLTELTLSPTMRHHVYRALSCALLAAVREGHLALNPCAGVTAPRKSDFEARTLTTQQAQRLLQVAWDTQMGPLLTVALSTGMRSGELFALTWADVDLTGGRLTVIKSVKWLPHGERRVGPPKTRSGRRTVWIDGPAVRALRVQRQRIVAMQLAAQAWTNLDLVFPSVSGAYRIPQGRFVNHFRALLSQADCPQIRFHDLRHTAGLFLTRSVGVVVTSRMLGHSNPSITMSLYGHAQEEDFGNAARAMGRLLNGPSPQ